MFTFVFYCRCLGVWRNADIHCWFNVDDVICKVRLVFMNCVEIMVGIFESQKCIQCKIFAVCCNEYIKYKWKYLLNQNTAIAFLATTTTTTTTAAAAATTPTTVTMYVK